MNIFKHSLSMPVAVGMSFNALSQYALMQYDCP